MDIVNNKMEGRDKLVICCIKAANPAKAVTITVLAPEGKEDGKNNQHRDDDVFVEANTSNVAVTRSPSP